jgi:hypothetical protein
MGKAVAISTILDPSFEHIVTYYARLTPSPSSKKLERIRKILSNLTEG